jgi:hypothetical protein
VAEHVPVAAAQAALARPPARVEAVLGPDRFVVVEGHHDRHPAGQEDVDHRQGEPLEDVMDVGHIRRGGVQQAVESVLGRPETVAASRRPTSVRAPVPAMGGNHTAQGVGAVSGSRTAKGTGWWPRSRSNASVASSTASAPPGPGR